MTKIIDVSTRQVYEITPPRAGENALLCPKCSSERRKKHAKSLQWNAGKGVGQCHHCMATFTEYRPFANGRREKEYTIPEWKNTTDVTDKALAFFTGRMISQETVSRMRIYSATEFMPQYGKSVPVICFPYFRNGELVNVKYRGPQKSFKMVSGAELIFYNLDCAATAKELVIVEGEMDALSLIEAGVTNVVSVPNGASGGELSYLDSCIDDLDHIETFYIATDFDEPGIKLQQELIRRLGTDRCRIVSFGGMKDANELLCTPEGATKIRHAIQNAMPLPISDVLDLPSYYNDIKALYEHGLEKGQAMGVGVIDEKVLWKTGQLVIWTGIPSHGKSAMMNFFAVRWQIQNGWKCAFFSPENLPYQKYLYPELASVITGKQFRKGFMDAEFDETFDYISDNFKFIDAGDDYTVETVIKAARTLVRRCGIKVLVIDPYNCFEHRMDKSRGENETQYIGRFLDALVRFARKYDVLVNLVAHPRKMERLSNASAYPAPTLYDINGSANFYNKADIGITVYRHFNKGPEGPHGTDLVLNKIRFKEQGTGGEKVNLQYNFHNGRYSEPVGDVHLLDARSYLRPEGGVLGAVNSLDDYNEKAPF